VGAIWRISITPRSRPAAMFLPMIKKDARISGRSGRYPYVPIPGRGLFERSRKCPTGFGAGFHLY
jgi:hypothetical protein